MAFAGLGLIGTLIWSQPLVAAREAATYVVRPGDTLGSIAAASGLTESVLTQINNLSNPNWILAGQTLNLGGDASGAGQPASPSSSAASSSATTDYVIQTGDDLWDIAQSAGVTVDAIVALNNLPNANSLQVGQHIKLPVPPTPTAKPGATPVVAITPAVLQQRIASAASSIGGSGVQIGVVALNLNTGTRIAINGDTSFPSASVMKLPILVEVERQVANGTLAWTGDLRSQVSAMISVSDNDAANKLMDTVGIQKVDATMSSLGLQNTHLVDHFGDTLPTPGAPDNQTTASDMVSLLHLITTDKIVNANVSADVRSLLATNQDSSKLARLLPAGAHVAHKSGWYTGVANDVGIVTAPGGTRWVIAVLTSGESTDESGDEVVAVISKAVYDAWAPSGS